MYPVAPRKKMDLSSINADMAAAWMSFVGTVNDVKEALLVCVLRCVGMKTFIYPKLKHGNPGRKVG